MNGLIVYLAAAVAFSAVLHQADCKPKASPFIYLSIGVSWPVLGAMAAYHTLAGEQVPRWGDGCRP